MSLYQATAKSTALILLKKVKKPYRFAAGIINNNYIEAPKVFISPELSYNLVYYEAFGVFRPVQKAFFLWAVTLKFYDFFFKKFPVFLILLIYFIGYVPTFLRKKIEIGSSQKTLGENPTFY